jgi:hypothetical protein
MTDKAHARFSPSSVSRRMACPGSLALEERVPAATSTYAEEGTAAHELMEWAFRDNATFLSVYEGKRTGNGWTITEDMIDAVQIFVDNIRTTAAGYEELGATVTIFCEERVSFADEMGDIKEDNKNENFFGTADIIIVAEFDDGTALISIDDLKYGKGVQVDAEENEQTLTYGLAVLSLYSMIYNITRVRMAIHQPRLDHLSEWEIPVKKLYKFRDKLRPAAQLTLKIADDLKAGRTTIKKIDKAGHLIPGEDQCFFCRAKNHCPARTRFVLSEVDDMFENLEDEVDVAGAVAKLDEGLVPIEFLEKKYFILDQLEDWIKGVRGRLEAELFSGKELETLKLVQGRKGHRAWINAARAEKALKKMRLSEKELYERKLISPTTAEKIFAKQNPRRWIKLKKLYAQPDGRPTLALKTDKRPAFVPPNIDNMFDDLTNESFENLA